MGQDSIIEPMLAVSLPLSLMFLLYIAFAVLAVLNIVTGIFVDSAIKQAGKMQDQDITGDLRRFFFGSKKQAACQAHGKARISREQFYAMTSETRMKALLTNLNIDLSDALTLFELLDEDGEGMVLTDNLISGIVRLRAGAKFLDVMCVLAQMDAVLEAIHGDMNDVRPRAEYLKDKRRTSVAALEISKQPSEMSGTGNHPKHHCKLPRRSVAH
eukprot:TRINITY_DN56980_c0_g1_i3.p1 TRINITY_DN56980_c0_g1~~TRINITY_DN56980_c0_g1_i3.p1  ORF type:complete len:246 (+),score=39.29 TRINITY_DN56980_c0_g1_i3:99-740(+)